VKVTLVSYVITTQCQNPEDPDLMKHVAGTVSYLMWQVEMCLCLCASPRVRRISFAGLRLNGITKQPHHCHSFIPRVCLCTRTHSERFYRCGTCKAPSLEFLCSWGYGFRISAVYRVHRPFLVSTSWQLWIV
jgi:hypothetical protein